MNKFLKLVEALKFAKMFDAVTTLFTFIGFFVTMLWLSGIFNVGNFVLYYGDSSQICVNTKTKQIKEIK